MKKTIIAAFLLLLIPAFAFAGGTETVVNTASNGVNVVQVVGSGTNACASPSVAIGTAQVNLSGTGTTQIVAASTTGTQHVQICAWAIVGGGTSPTLEFETGTGTNCATGLAAISPALTPNSSNEWDSPPGDMTKLDSGKSNEVCLTLGGTSPTAIGLVIYATP